MRRLSAVPGLPGAHGYSSQSAWIAAASALASGRSLAYSGLLLTLRRRSAGRGGFWFSRFGPRNPGDCLASE
jgi:hypothetical protein